MSVEVYVLGAERTTSIVGKKMMVLGAQQQINAEATLTFATGGSNYTVPSGKKFRITELIFAGNHPGDAYGYFNIVFGSTPIATTVPLFGVAIHVPMIVDVPGGNTIIAYAKMTKNACYHSAVLVGYEIAV